MSIEQYANRVIEILVIKGTLPKFIQRLRNEGTNSEKINNSEALIFSVFPFTVMATSSHFMEESDRFRTALLDSTVEHIIKVSSISVIDAKQLIAKRLIEYCDATFEKDNAFLSVSETGLHDLSRLAFNNITSGEPPGLSILMLIWAHLTATIASYEGGAVLKKHYELYLKIGDEKWVDTMSKVFESED